MAQKKLSAIITVGGAVSSTLGRAFGAVRGETTKVGDAISKLTARQRELGSVIRQQEALGRNASALKVQFANQELGLIGRQIEALKRKQALEQRIVTAQKANIARRAELRGNILDAVVVGAGITAPLSQAIKFENAMLGVAKQVDGARDKSGKLTPVYFEMGRAIQQLGREIPVATNSLAEMVTAGARMGVAKDQLIQFTRVGAMMAEAFEAEPGALAEQMGKISGLYKIPIPAIGALADSINYLDDNAISKGADIIDFLTRVGGVAGAVKIGGLEVAALGSTLLTLGERTETAGTATNAMLQKFAAAEKGTQKFRDAMAEIGMDPSQVQRGMQANAQGTILQVLEAINKLPQDKRLGVMVELVGLEHSDTIAKLAGNLGEYRRQIALAHSEEAKGSMTREFQARMQTTGAQLKIASNRVSELAVNIGSVLLPGINGILGAIGPVISGLAGLAQQFPRVTAAVVGTVVGLGALRVGSWAAMYAFTFLKGGALSMAAIWTARLLPAIKAVGTAVVLVGRAMLLNPIGLAVTGIALSVGLIYKYWGPLSTWFANLWGEIKNSFTAVFDWIVGKIGYLMELPGKVANKVGSVLGIGANSAPVGGSTMDGFGASAGLPDVPGVATRGTTNNVTDNRTTNFTINQRPGQDARELANEIERMQRRALDVKARSSLLDGAGAQ